MNKSHLVRVEFFFQFTIIKELFICFGHTHMRDICGSFSFRAMSSSDLGIRATLPSLNKSAVYRLHLFSGRDYESGISSYMVKYALYTRTYTYTCIYETEDLLHSRELLTNDS